MQKICRVLQKICRYCRKSAGIAENLQVLQKICRCCRKSAGIAENLQSGPLRDRRRVFRVKWGQPRCARAAPKSAETPPSFGRARKISNPLPRDVRSEGDRGYPPSRDVTPKHVTPLYLRERVTPSPRHCPTWRGVSPSRDVTPKHVTPLYLRERVTPSPRHCPTCLADKVYGCWVWGRKCPLFKTSVSSAN